LVQSVCIADASLEDTISIFLTIIEASSSIVIEVPILVGITLLSHLQAGLILSTKIKTKTIENG
jgi:hypothetical protein